VALKLQISFGHHQGDPKLFSDVEKIMFDSRLAKNVKEKEAD